MKSLYDVPAPAKLNLFLHITGRRADGYHLLQSTFMLIDWCDTLHFECRSDGQITRTDLTHALPADDLITRAARALQSATACPLGAHISVEKRIPAQAGMGGGSSDAASCLLALNRLWDLGLSVQQLSRIGLQLGADVPFFLFGRNAWVEGIGEHMTALDLPAARFLVIKPDAGLDTKTIFSALDLKRDTNTSTIADFAAYPYSFGCNDLQPVAMRQCPQVNQALKWLDSAGLKGRMTGSGSSVFAPLTNEVRISDAPKSWLIQECKNLIVHPLQGWAISDS